jgi:hypothetical protein
MYILFLFNFYFYHYHLLDHTSNEQKIDKKIYLVLVLQFLNRNIKTDDK